MYRLRAVAFFLLLAVAQCQTEYEWRIEDYGECSGTECGNGWQFRQVTCVIVGTDSVQSDSNCGMPKPSTWQQCSVGECEETQVPVSNVVYEWVESDWQTCTVTCGGGVQNRFVGCTADGRPISTVFCEGLDSLGQMPATSQPCNVIECSGTTPGVSYDFYAGDWEECSAECDGGVQTRRVLCVGQDLTYAYQASEEECTRRGLDVPISEQPCNMQSCDPASRTTQSPRTTAVPPTTLTQSSGIQVRYIEGSFSACSATCGYATRTRHVLCVQTLNGVHTHVDDSVCQEPKPEETVVCEGLRPCPDAATPTTEETPSTSVPTMVPITTTIAPSTTMVYQKTTVYITGEPTTEYVPDPSIERPTYVVGQFGLCDCLTRQKNRYVICVDYRSDRVVMIAEKHCIATDQQKPDTNKDCDAGECPGTAAPPLVTEWSRIILGGCSKTCGGGVQRFQVECVDTATSQPVPEQHCDVALRPLDTTECATNQCEDDDVIRGSFWSIGPWSGCSVTCGTGEQTRPVNCYYYIDGPTTEISTECDIPTKPYTTQQCDNGPCNGYWVSSEWSECSASCGFGVQSRTVDCRWEKTDLYAIDDSQCSGNKPITQTGCKIDDCLINYDCGNVFQGSAGNISSPYYPYNYPNDVICKNVIVADDSGNDVYVEIDFQVLEIEDDTDCSFDYIEVYDMKTGIRDRICRAHEMPMKWASNGNMVEVTFVSDTSVNMKGFSASWKRMEKEIV